MTAWMSESFASAGLPAALPLSGMLHRLQGPPKAGSLRPPDPNRRQDLDLMSAGAEQDADYMRMVHDVSWGLKGASLNSHLVPQQHMQIPIPANTD